MVRFVATDQNPRDCAAIHRSSFLLSQRTDQMVMGLDVMEAPEQCPHSVAPSGIHTFTTVCYWTEKRQRKTYTASPQLFIEKLISARPQWKKLMILGQLTDPAAI